MDWICAQTGAEEARREEHIQSLWSGYGEIYRVGLMGAEVPSVIVKHVSPPGTSSEGHPVGWNTTMSHQRKLRSYAVEHAWYRDWSARCSERCRVPAFLGGKAGDNAWLFLLEDLDASGYPERRYDLCEAELNQCLSWLAAFHAAHLGETPAALWEVGTYWHLATRPDELAQMRDDVLREAASVIDARLNSCGYQTLVHGDAKVANFCFGKDGVAAVDFQYVGGGCGIKDVAYFFSSCLSARECERHAERHLETYFDRLREALAGSDVDAEAVVTEWRALYPWAWADFHRFLAGWSPAHWKIHTYSQRMTAQVLHALSPEG